MVRGLLLVSVLGLGIAVGARADAPKPVRKWEQYCTRQKRAAGLDDLMESANRDMKEKGDAGWELAGAAYSETVFLYCFKRPGP
jgi:hypothetical protein